MKLIIAIIRDGDNDRVSNKLTEAGLRVTCIADWRIPAQWTKHFADRRGREPSGRRLGYSSFRNDPDKGRD
jgi:hypothetical protein